MARLKRSDLMRIRVEQINNLRKFNTSPSEEVQNYWNEQQRQDLIMMGYYKALEEMEGSDTDDDFPFPTLTSVERIKK